MITICDTGPLAYLNRNDPYHSWAAAIMKQVRPPVLTCESVFTEAALALGEGTALDPSQTWPSLLAARLQGSDATKQCEVYDRPLSWNQRNESWTLDR